MTMHQRRRCAGPRRNQERKEVKPEEYTIYERVPALSPGSFDERHMRRNLRIAKLYGFTIGLVELQDSAHTVVNSLA